MGRHEGATKSLASPDLEKENHARAIHASLSLEGNTLSLEQVSTLLAGEPVEAPARDLQEVENALRCDDLLSTWAPSSSEDFLEAHELMMAGLVARPGRWRTADLAVARERNPPHHPPAAFGLPGLMKKLFSWIGSANDLPPPILAAVCLHEFEFMQPFQEGNGRLGRLWHRAILVRHHPLFAQVPIESAIRDRQSEYHEALASCENSGTTTLFLELALEITLSALTATQSLPQSRQPPRHRIRNARAHFGPASFRRKDYLALFPGLSSATASRDLHHAVKEGTLVKTGEKAKASYAEPAHEPTSAKP